MACCCSSCLFGENVQMIGGDFFCGGSYAAACLAHFCLGAAFTTAAVLAFGIPLPPPFSFLVQMCARRRIRHKYSLPEEPCCDCLVSLACSCCSLVQEAKELRIRNQYYVSHVEPVMMVAPGPQFMSPNTMVMPPPLPPPYAQGYPIINQPMPMPMYSQPYPPMKADPYTDPYAPGGGASSSGNGAYVTSPTTVMMPPPGYPVTRGGAE
eukprot:jgi/Chlat1/6479/Chrsp45S06055